MGDAGTSVADEAATGVADRGGEGQSAVMKTAVTMALAPWMPSSPPSMRCWCVRRPPSRRPGSPGPHVTDPAARSLDIRLVFVWVVSRVVVKALAQLSQIAACGIQIFQCRHGSPNLSSRRSTRQSFPNTAYWKFLRRVKIDGSDNVCARQNLE